jgi:thiamine biosynthesis protein ThiI
LDDKEPVQNVVLVASAESVLKSAPVRRTLEQRLVGDLKLSLTKAGYNEFSVERHAARIVIRGIQDSLGAAQCCSHVFGVAYAAPALMLPASLETVIEKIKETAEGILEPHQTFAIRCHRSSPSPLSRREIEVKGGSEVLQELSKLGISVKLKEPDVTISVDLAGERVYIYHSKLVGPSGLPLSSQWKLLAVLDSGVFTLLAAYAMMRRGCLVELLIPQSESMPLFKSDEQLNLARRLRALVTRQNYRAFVLQVDQLKTINPHHVDDSAYLRSLIRQAALELARRKHFKGIVCADVAGQIDYESETDIKSPADWGPPVFQPLIGLDVVDLVELAREAGISSDELSNQFGMPPEISTAVNLGSARSQESLSFQEVML